MITFLWPFALLFLPLPLIARRFLKPQTEQAAGALRVPFFHGLAGGGATVAAGKRSSAILAAFIWLLLIAFRAWLATLAGGGDDSWGV